MSRVLRYKRAHAHGERPLRVHVLRFNCDAYVDASGTRHPGLFRHTGTETKLGKRKRGDASVLTVRPTPAFATAIESVVERILQLAVRAESEAGWLLGKPELEVERMRYDS